MTSKNLFFKLMKEDFKSRLWAAALLSLGCFFLYPVVAAFMAGEIKEYLTYEAGVRQYSRNLLSWLSFDSGMTVFLVTVTSLVCGLSSFSYLNNKSKVDFFHGIPVKRERLYAANYINGILLLAVPYAVCLLLAVFIGISNGVEPGHLWSAALAAYGLHMTYYILMYTTVVIAAMMTGNLIIGFLGSVVFAAVVPLTVTIVYAYFATFFQTYLPDMHENLVKNLIRISPVAEYLYQVGRYGKNTNMILAALGALAVSALLAALGCFLYKKRPSEAAGKAMAFAVTRPVIRCILTIVSALGLGLFFWTMRHSTGWAVFGVICGGVICHCVIEIIYHFDFKKLFSNKGQLAVCVVFSMAVLFIFRYDLAGYDRYLPQAGQVKDAAVSVNVLNDWVSYGSVRKDGEGNYDWDSGNTYEHVFENMHYQDMENLLSIAAEGVRICGEMKKQSSYIDASGAYTADSSDEQKEYYSRVVIAYTLNSGRKVYRSYWMYLDDVMPQMEKLYMDSAFLKGTYPVLEKTADQVAAVRYRDYGDEQVLEQLSPAEKQELLETYQEEFAALTLAGMQKELPTGLIRFSSEDEEDAMRWQRRMDDDKEYREQHVFYSYGYYASFDNRNYYPVYPSFTKTLQLLKKHNIVLQTGYKPEAIENVKVWEYEYDENDEYSGVTKETLISVPEEIRELSKVLYNSNLTYYNGLFRCEDINIELVINKNEKEYNYSAVVPEGKLPRFVWDRLSEKR